VIQEAFTPANQTADIGDLLLEFFHFYLFDYKLGVEVISIDGPAPFSPYKPRQHIHF
jgi:hypothetical protein